MDYNFSNPKLKPYHASKIIGVLQNLYIRRTPIPIIKQISEKKLISKLLK